MTNVTRTRILGVDQIPATREIKADFSTPRLILIMVILRSKTTECFADSPGEILHFFQVVNGQDWRYSAWEKWQVWAIAASSTNLYGDFRC